MSCEIHAIVEDTANLNTAIRGSSIQEEVTRATHAVGRGLHAVPTVPKMVGPCRRSDLQSNLATRALRIIRHVQDGAN